MMHHRDRTLHGWLKWVAAAAAAMLPVCASAQSNLDATFRDLINARNVAIERGDSAAVHHGITDDMEWVVGANGVPLSAAQLLTAISHAPNPRPGWTIDSVHARSLGRGDVATVTYRRLDRRGSGNAGTVTLIRALEVYVRRSGRWLLVNHSHAWIVQSPPMIALDSTALAAFVGRYDIGGDIVDNVHFEGGHLVATLSGQTEGGVLLPVSESAFSPDGVAPVMVFERDASGRVIGYVQGGPDGNVRRARRIAP